MADKTKTGDEQKALIANLEVDLNTQKNDRESAEKALQEKIAELEADKEERTKEHEIAKKLIEDLEGRMGNMKEDLKKSKSKFEDEKKAL